MFANRFNKLLLAVLCFSGAARADRIYTYCYYKTGYFMLHDENGKPVISDAKYLQNVKFYAVEMSEFEHLNASCKNQSKSKNVEFLRVEASSIRSGKLYEWYLGKVSLHYPLIGLQESPQEQIVRSILNEMPERMNFSSDMNNDKDIVAYKNKIKDLKKIVPSRDFEGQFLLDFDRQNYKVMSGNKVIYEHTKKDDLSGPLFEKHLNRIFEALDDAVPFDLHVELGSLPIQKNIAIALATRTQTFAQASADMIFAPIKKYCDSHHKFSCPQLKGSRVEYMIRVEKEALVLEADYSYEISTYDTGPLVTVGVYLCHRKMTMNLRTGAFSPDETTIWKF